MEKKNNDMSCFHSQYYLMIQSIFYPYTSAVQYNHSFIQTKFTVKINCDILTSDIAMGTTFLAQTD